jgi:osmoprotectant transport system permease protein
MDKNLMQQILLYYVVNHHVILGAMWQQFLMAFDGVFLAVIVGVPLGICSQHFPFLAKIVMTLTNMVQIIPGLALMSLLMIVFGLGSETVVMTIFLYALLPIVGNTLTGLLSVPKSLQAVGRGLGMTNWQVLFKITLPNALSAIGNGIRSALIVAISIATMGAFIGGGGLGDFIISGLNASDGRVLIIAAVVPTIGLAVGCDKVIEKVMQLLALPTAK